jgi:hypothetical protein
MYEQILPLYFFPFCSSPVWVQDLRFNTYGSYAFDDKVDSYYSKDSYFNGKLKGGFIWGGGIKLSLLEVCW